VQALNDIGSKMTCEVQLLSPSTQQRDVLGGETAKTYTLAGTVWAQKRDKTSTFRQVIGDYVTVNTCYFVAWDFLSTYAINTEWRLEVNGQRYAINSIVLIDDRLPHRIEIEATRLGGIG